MSNGAGQTAIMAAVVGTVGVFITHLGVEVAIKKPTQMLTIGQSMPETNYVQAALFLGLGIALLASAAKLIVSAIETALFPETVTVSELWDEMSPSLQHRLHYTVSKDYSRVVLKNDDLHTMMNLGKQRHVRFVGKEGGVVEISKSMSRFISNVPRSDIRFVPVASSPSRTAMPDSFWTPQQSFPVPQN